MVGFQLPIGAPISIEGFRNQRLLCGGYARVGERRVQTHCMVIPRVPCFYSRNSVEWSARLSEKQTAAVRFRYTGPIYSRLVCNGSNLAFEAGSGGPIPSAGANLRKLFDSAIFLTSAWQIGYSAQKTW